MRWLGGGRCPEPGLLMQGKKNKIVSLFSVSVCVVGLPMPASLPPALRTAGFSNGSLGKRSAGGSLGKKPGGSLGSRPSAPFRSNVYQPTEMAVVLNGGTVSIRM